MVHQILPRRNARPDSTPARVLLVGHTRLSTRYMLEHYRLLSEDARLEFAITRATDDYPAGVESMIDATGLPRLPYCVAVRRCWDLALFGTHGSEIHFDARRVHISHGLGAGKLVDGQDFTYSPRWSLWHGQSKYDVMLEASHEVARNAINRCPELSGTIAVVGDLRADRLLAANADRARHRASLGLAPGDIALVVTSTFGPHGLLGSTGLTLIDAALSLGPPFRVLLTAHPHVWTGRYDHRRELDAALAPRVRSGLVVCGPDDDWAPFLAAADVAIIDHGSLSLYWALLARPTVAVPVPARLINPGASIAALRATCPQLADPKHLADTLDLARSEHAPEHLAGLRSSIASYPDQAEHRTRAVLYRLLGLPAPAAVANVA